MTSAFIKFCFSNSAFFQCCRDSDEEPQIVCKTWYETYCNTTLVKEDAGNNQVRPHTWCDKVPKKICAPDYCQMIPGKYPAGWKRTKKLTEQCNDSLREPGLSRGYNPINPGCPKGDLWPSADIWLSYGDKHGSIFSSSAKLCRSSQRVLPHEDGGAKER